MVIRSGQPGCTGRIRSFHSFESRGGDPANLHVAMKDHPAYSAASSFQTGVTNGCFSDRNGTSETRSQRLRFAFNRS